MSHLIRCLLLMPLVADAEWSDSASSPRPAPSPARGVAPTVSAPADTHLPIRLVAADETLGPDRSHSLAAGPPLSVSKQSAVPQPARLQLPPPRNVDRSLESSRGKAGAGQALTSVVGSLAVVLAAFFLFAWATRRVAPRGLNLLPREVVESLGRAPLCGRQQLQLLRIGNRLLLLSVTATEARTLTEITDPAEVDRLAGLCQQIRPESVTATFRHILAQCAGDSTLRDLPASAGRRAAERGNVPVSRLLARGQDHG